MTLLCPRFIFRGKSLILCHFYKAFIVDLVALLMYCMLIQSFLHKKCMALIRFAIVGCGRIAKRHSDILGKRLVDHCELVGVCDKIPERVAIIASTYNLHPYTNMHIMMEEVNPDVVVVLTESGNHARDVIELAPYGKHIVVEKPMALSLEDADSMIKACDYYGIKLFVVKQNRFNLPILKLREAVQSQRFGKMVLGTVRVRWCRTQSYYDQDSWRGTWSMDGGVISNQASHHIDMLLWMMGDVDTVHALGATQLVNIEAEDTAVVSLRFRNGALGVIEATTATRPKDQEGSISILGEEGMVEVGGFAMNVIKTWQFSHSTPEDQEVATKYSVNPPNVYGFGHQEYYAHVVRSILSEEPNMIDGLAGRKSLELIIAIYESMEKEQPIKLLLSPNHTRLGKSYP
jgi:UDP-N-acetyl-2-amino-2-deoxyglucuronate dehydrogenase